MSYLFAIPPLGANHLTFDGDMGDSVKKFFPKPLEIKFFPQTYNSVIYIYIYIYIFFFQHNTPWEIHFFQCRNFFPQVFPFKIFFPSKSVNSLFFSEITHTPFPPQKSNGWPLRIGKSFKCFRVRGYHTLRG